MAVAEARLWLEPGVGWVACWGCPSSPASTPSSFQSADSVLGLQASKSVCMFFKSSLSFLQPSSKADWFSNKPRGLNFLVPDPRAGVPNVELKSLTP